MKKALFILSALVVSLTSGLVGQNIELTFTGDNNGQPVTLDSVYVRNYTQGGEVTLYPPDLTLVLILTGIENEINTKNNSFGLNQNYPNPCGKQTSIQLQIPERAKVEILISNLLGQKLLDLNKTLSAGIHTFSFAPGNETCYFLTATYKGHTKTIKMLCNTDELVHTISLKKMGHTDSNPAFKSLEFIGELPFELGDELLIVAYSQFGESGIVKSPETNQEYIMQFATNIPCPGAETVTWEGQTYNTIQVFGQCWFKENLNAGRMIASSQPQTNNDTIEKYCMGNDEYYCSLFGGLYFWNEMMQFANQTGGQGICPSTGGWHIPDDLDWQILEGAVDSLYKIGDPAWGSNNWRGSDAGGNLKQTGTTYWEPPNTGASDAFGFSALPGGYFVQNAFWGPGYKTYLWSSQFPQKYYRNMDYDQSKVNRNLGGNEAAFSVRCVKN